MLMESQVDSASVQAPEHRPKLTISDGIGLPLIDLSPLLHSPIPDDGVSMPPVISKLVAEIEAACQEWGSFQVINHGVPPELLESLMAVSREFFKLPAEEKRKVRWDEVNPLGYFESEHTNNVRNEVFELFVEEPCGDERLRNQWPRDPPGFRDACEKYGKAVKELAIKLLELIALSLNLPSKRLNGFFEDESGSMILSRSLPCLEPHLAPSVDLHKGKGALVILAQDDAGGFDVKRRSDGERIRVKPISNSYIINIGDIIQVWSNDKYESAEHRVAVNSERESFRIPFFFNPAHHVMVKPLEELVDERKSPAKYKAYNWGEVFWKRKASKLMKNIQIVKT